MTVKIFAWSAELEVVSPFLWRVSYKNVRTGTTIVFLFPIKPSQKVGQSLN